MQAAAQTSNPAKPATGIRYKEIAFTAQPSTDLARSRKFYEGVLGLKPNAEVKPDAVFVEYNIGPGCLAVGQSKDWPPSKDGPCVALEVEDFQAAVAVLKQHQVEFILGPAEMPRCWMAAFRDPDGNRVSIHHRKAQ
jgi:catechol 2,3-dioxygenase-like lactoylglutathione lyase family enzyme